MPERYVYERRFNPPTVLAPENRESVIPGDRRDGRVYVFDENVILAVNVALATGRLLLVSGASGSGKSSLAASVARVLDRRYYEAVVTERTRARDLQDPLRHRPEVERCAGPAVGRVPWGSPIRRAGRVVVGV